MSGRRLTVDEAIARINELLEDVGPDAIDELRRRMLHIMTPVDELERLGRLAFCVVPGCHGLPTMRAHDRDTGDEYRVCVEHAGELEHPVGDKTCDTCGEPATIAARHVLERWDPAAADAQFEPGKTRYGCDDHPVESEVIRVSDDQILRQLASGIPEQDRER